MDEEVITWNLKGPKRFKKRKELNALIKNNIKYKSLAGINGSNSLNLDMFSIGGGTSGSNRRLLSYTHHNSSSTEDVDDNFFFSANKQILRE